MRLKILEAANRLIAHKSFHRVKVEEIASEAGIGKGTVYVYFPSKEKIFEDLFKYATEKYIEMAKKATSGNESCEDKLIILAQNHGDFLAQFESLDSYAFSTSNQGFQEMHLWFLEKKKEYLQIVEDILKDGVLKKEIRRIDTKLAARFFTGAFLFSLDPFLVNLRQEGEQIAKDVVYLFLQGAEK